MITPYIIRTICAGILIFCSIIVLALSADLENQLHSFGFTTSWLPFAAFVGAFTLIIEIFLIAMRIFAGESVVTWVGVDLVWAGLMWVFWLAAAASVSSNTSSCNTFHVASVSCNKARADTAFLWIGWIVWWVVIGMLLLIGVGEHRSGNSGVWQAPIGSQSSVSQSYAGDNVMTERSAA